MRTITPTALAKVTEQFGTEPINIVEVLWNPDGVRSSYADRDIGTSKGRITDISGLDFIINVSEGSDSAEIQLTLSDVDGDLKTIIDTVDVHKRDVWVYQTFDGLADTHKFLIFRGEINSPIVWNEGDRTLRFSVITKIEDAEIGFSIEEGQFDAPAPELIGKAWPLKFGTTINVPALRYTSPRSGTLASGVGISDFTLPYRIQKAKALVCPVVFRGYVGDYVGNSFVIRPVYTYDEGCVLNKCTTIATLENQLDQQRDYEYEQITIIDGEFFPQGVELTLNIDGGKFTGSFEGTAEAPTNIFTITSREHPKFDELGGVPTDASVNAILKEEKDEAVTINCGGAGGGEAAGPNGVIVQPITTPTDQTRKGVEASEKSHQFFNAIPEAGFFWASVGTEVTIDTGDGLVYASNLVPETVHRVAAFRQFDGVTRLVTVPPSLYTTRTSDFNSYTVSEIVFDIPLTQVHEDWVDNEIYVTSTSTVGPNTVNIMEWLIAKYTALGTDTTTFNYVRNKLANYPMDFPYLERKNILEALQELAFQARCAIYLRDGKFYLKYLPELADSVATVDESDVDANTLELFHSDTEDIVTKLIAEWKRDYSFDDPNKIILRHNVIKYGTQEETFDFYAFNELDYVHKSATFWLIRKSNTWRKLRFQTPLQHLALETFDTIDIDLGDIAPIIIPGILEQANYDSNSQALQFEAWTPVRSGTTEVYDFAHPANINEELQWPTEEDRDSKNIGSGDAPGFDTFAPDGHVLGGGQVGVQGFQFGPCASQGSTVKSFTNQTCGNGNGDTYPSDEGDTIKEKTLEGDAPPDTPVEEGEIYVGDGPSQYYGGETKEAELERRLDSAEQAARQAQSVAEAANEASGGDGSGTQDPDPGPDALPTPDEFKENLPEGMEHCYADVTVHMLTAEILFNDTDPGFANVGQLGYGPDAGNDTYSFKCCDEANAFAFAINKQFQARQDAQNISKGETLPYTATRICGDLLDPCECSGNDNPTPQAFESSQPEETANQDYLDDLPNYFP